MRDGHYTAGDIDELTVLPADKKFGVPKMLMGKVDDVKILSDGFKIIIKRGHEEIFENGMIKTKEVPPKYRVVAEIIRKKAAGRGGWRVRAGAKKGNGPKKKTFSFKLTEEEGEQVKAYIEKIRFKNSLLESKRKLDSYEWKIHLYVWNGEGDISVIEKLAKELNRNYLDDIDSHKARMLEAKEYTARLVAK